MGVGNSPIQPNHIKEIIQSVNDFNDASPNNNKIIINSLNVVINGNQINYDSSNSAQQQPIKISEENNEPIFISIFINSDFGQLKLQVNLNESIGDIIEKYKNKLQKDNILKISLYTENNYLMEPNNKLKDYGIQNNNIINAKIEYKPNINIKKRESNFSNTEIPSEDLENLKNLIKEKKRQGFITVAVINSAKKSQYFHVKPDVKFKMIAEQYRNENPGSQWIFLSNGRIVDSEKTLKELNFKLLTKVIANEFT